MTITIDDMKDKLLTVDETMHRLSGFEPLSTLPLTAESSVGFEVKPDWRLNLDTLADTDPVDVFITVDGTERQLTKEALAQIAVASGLQTATLKKAPHDAIESWLTRLYRNPSKDYSVFVTGDKAAALAPATITPFSNVRLAESVLEHIDQKYGGEVYVDYKMSNTLTTTDIRFIIPGESRRMLDTQMADIPSGEADLWAAGVHLSNSLIGKSQTFVDTYLFRWWCTNGCTTTNNKVGSWDRRRKENDPEDVYSWIGSAVDSALEGMEEKFDLVQRLNELEIGNASAAVGEVFAQFNLPAAQRNHILETVSQTRHLTMYSLMQAVTSAANTPGLPTKDVERLLRIGGVLYGDATLDSQKARIWDAGHFASPEATNPFAPIRRS